MHATTRARRGAPLTPRRKTRNERLGCVAARLIDRSATGGWTARSDITLADGRKFRAEICTTEREKDEGGAYLAIQVVVWHPETGDPFRGVARSVRTGTYGDYLWLNLRDVRKIEPELALRS